MAKWAFESGSPILSPTRHQTGAQWLHYDVGCAVDGSWKAMNLLNVFQHKLESTMKFGLPGQSYASVKKTGKKIPEPLRHTLMCSMNALSKPYFLRAKAVAKLINIPPPPPRGEVSGICLAFSSLLFHTEK